MSRDKREAESAERRARRLAERAEERARRKEEQAVSSAQRAQRLAERAARQSSRGRARDNTIEDIVDEVTQKAEAWIGDTTRSLFHGDDEQEIRRAERKAERAQQDAAAARAAAEQANSAAENIRHADSVTGDRSTDDLYQERPSHRRRSKRSQRSQQSGRFDWSSFDFPDRHAFYGAWHKSKRKRGAHLYRDKERGKFLGVCAGFADYFGRPAWEMRLYAVLGLFFVPSLLIPTYFIAYFLMDDKPYFRRVTDRFGEPVDASADDESHYRDLEQEADLQTGKRNRDSQLSNVQAMKLARDKFSDIEQSLRQMERHVTSSQFELQRELRKISGED